MNNPAPVSPAKTPEPSLIKLPLDQLLADPNQPRKNFDDTSIAELASSIKDKGLLQPIVVRPNGKGYYIVAGERRFRACKVAGLKEVPVLVRSDLNMIEIPALQLIENIQREDLSLPEQCEAVAKLVSAVTFKRAAEMLGKSDAWVSKRVNALKAPDAIVKLLKTGEISDLEVVGNLVEIHALDKEDAEDRIGEVKELAKEGNPVSRADSREWLAFAKRRKQWDKEQAERDAREKAEAERKASRPKSIGALTKEELQEKQNDRVKERRKQLRELAYSSSYASLGLKPSQMDQHLGPLVIDYGSDFNNYVDKKPPAHVGQCTFQVKGRGDVAYLTKLAAGFSKKAEIRVDLPELTLDQSARLEKALKDVKDIGLEFEFTVNGAQLVDMCKRLHPKKAVPAGMAELLAPPVANAGAKKPAKK